jgi:hypothetical protein
VDCASIGAPHTFLIDVGQLTLDRVSMHGMEGDAKYLRTRVSKSLFGFQVHFGVALSTGFATAGSN